MPTSELTWVTVDAAPILGDSRPRSLREVFSKGGIWLELYRAWLQERNPSMMDGYTYLTTGRTAGHTNRGALEAAYPSFYQAAGQLKEALRKRPGSVAAQFPWAPAHAPALLGDARPKTLRDLIAEGRTSQWYPVARAWYAYAKPIPQAEAWLDWAMEDERHAATWAAALETTMPGFIHEVGVLKDYYRAGGSAESLKWGNAERERRRKLAEREQQEQRAKEQQAKERQAQQQRGETKPQQPQQQRAPAAAPQSATDPRRQLADGLLAQINLVARFVRPAAGYAEYCADIGGRLEQLGGEVGRVGETMRAYATLVAGNAEQLDAVRQAANAARVDRNADLQEPIRQLRDAVYTLAWNIDLAYQNYWGGWPHDQLQLALAPIADGPENYLRYVAARTLRQPVAHLPELCRRASEVLDGCRAVVEAKIAGYRGGDSAQLWGAHEVAREAERAQALCTWLDTWSAERGERPEDFDALIGQVFLPAAIEHE
jgi:hypothetical protein